MHGTVSLGDRSGFGSTVRFVSNDTGEAVECAVDTSSKFSVRIPHPAVYSVRLEIACGPVLELVDPWGIALDPSRPWLPHLRAPEVARVVGCVLDQGGQPAGEATVRAADRERRYHGWQIVRQPVGVVDELGRFDVRLCVGADPLVTVEHDELRQRWSGLVSRQLGTEVVDLGVLRLSQLDPESVAASDTPDEDSAQRAERVRRAREARRARATPVQPVDMVTLLPGHHRLRGQVLGLPPALLPITRVFVVRNELGTSTRSRFSFEIPLDGDARLVPHPAIPQGRFDVYLSYEERGALGCSGFSPTPLLGARLGPFRQAEPIATVQAGTTPTDLELTWKPLKRIEVFTQSHGKPVAHVRVIAMPERDSVVVHPVSRHRYTTDADPFFWQPSIITDEEGRGTFYAPHGGTWELFALAPGAPIASGPVVVRCPDSVQAAVLDVSPTTVDGHVDLSALSTRAHRKSTNLHNAEVFVYPSHVSQEDEEDLPEIAPGVRLPARWRTMRSVEIDAAGRFSIPNLPPGEWDLRLRTDSVRASKRISVKGGEDVIHVELTPH